MTDTAVSPFNGGAMTAADRRLRAPLLPLLAQEIKRRRALAAISSFASPGRPHMTSLLRGSSLAKMRIADPIASAAKWSQIPDMRDPRRKGAPALRLSAAQLEALAARYVWWQPPAETLQEPTILLWQILKVGTAEDYVLARSHWGEEAFRRALAETRPGALDERSWVFWHRHFGLGPRPFPRRTFG